MEGPAVTQMEDSAVMQITTSPHGRAAGITPKASNRISEAGLEGDSRGWLEDFGMSSSTIIVFLKPQIESQVALPNVPHLAVCIQPDIPR
jgi:hypothetical protein